MSSRRDELKALIAQIQQQKPPSTRRYGAELKRAIVEYAQARRTENATITQVADELGLSATQVSKWLRHAARRRQSGQPPFEPIQRPTPEVLAAWNERLARSAELPSQAADSDAPDFDTPNPAVHPKSEESDMVFLVHCSGVHIHAIARERLRELLDA